MPAERLQRIAVVGAAGKMGSLIALLLLQEMTLQTLESSYPFFCVDTDAEALYALRPFFRQKLTIFAEKNIGKLRRGYDDNEDLVSNADMIRAFVENALDRLHLSTHLETALGATLLFEAVPESVEIKTKILSSLQHPDTFYFSNTSAIPIHVLQEKTNLKNRLIGFHFYNPPPTQKVMEVVLPEGTDPELKEIALELAARLGKDAVLAIDQAGFIGNGYLLREFCFACKLVKELSRQYTEEEAIWRVESITRDLLLRPMGVFQLIDFIGPSTVQSIASIMSRYLPDENFQDPLLDGRKFFHYEKNKPVRFASGKDFPVLSDWTAPTLSWRELKRMKDPIPEIKAHFRALSDPLAHRFLLEGAKIVEQLQADGIEKVLKEGFGHLYLPQEVL